MKKSPRWLVVPSIAAITTAVALTGCKSSKITDNAPDDLTSAEPEHSVEVITETPFARDGERLDYVTFEVDRIISTRGQLSTREVSAPAPAP